MTISINKDIVIIGGGIAGLWLLNRLRNEGYDALLLESKALGSGQSIASQGMIHGGIKYALSGALTSAAQAIADMPDHWKACLQGKGDVDLRGTNILSKQYYMWPRTSVRSRLNAFLGSKVLRGRVDPVKQADFPAIFQNHIDGPLYQLNDVVLDVPSLLQTLSKNHQQAIRKIDWQHSHFIQNTQGEIESLKINTDEVAIKAKRYIFTSGEGNKALLSEHSLAQANPIEMQLRPLQMTLVKHQFSNPIYAHCVNEQLSSTPEVTITSHQCKDGDWAWYLGGELAESGANRAQEEQIQAAKAKMKSIIPWCDLEHAQWHSFFINRAEAKQADGKRPENPSLIPHKNIIACWPSKLTLSPSLANEVLVHLTNEDVCPSPVHDTTDLSFLPFPPIATTPWDAM